MFVAWQVLRSYDTRFRSTERKPHLYLLHGAGGKSIIFPKEERAVEVLSIEDHSWNKADFDFGVLAGVLVDRQWLWSFTGKLLVIATPFREGQHDATKPADFLPIVRHLEYLHEQNVVHGDIRAFNIVFGTTAEGPSDEEGGASGGVFKASQGCLIDFDFGGNLDSNPRYPEGYMKVLGDGSRIGTARAEIQTHEDWYALAYVIFALHEFSVRVPDIPTSSSVLRGQEDSLFSQQERVWRAFKCLKEGDDDSVAIENLKEFLQGADEAGLRVTQGRSFAECFKTSRPASSYATGSPPKK